MNLVNFNFITPFIEISLIETIGGLILFEFCVAFLFTSSQFHSGVFNSGKNEVSTSFYVSTVGEIDV